MANTRITQGVIKPNEDYDVRHINATGIVTAASVDVTNNLSVGGVLTYEDVTNVDSVGLITARKGIISSGVVTATAFHGSGASLTGIDATALKDPAGNVKVQAQASGAVHTGISTFDTVNVGSGVTIESNGQATFTGIVTFGSGSTTIDNNVVNVGTALTLGHTQGVQFHTQNLHSQGFEVNQINASGIITASSFSGDGSNLTSLPAGLGTALSSVQSSPLNKIYYTNSVLGIDNNTTIDVPASASAAYTQYTDINIANGVDLIISDGDDLVPDVLGLRPDGTYGGGSIGRIRVDKLVGKDANSAINVEKGLIIAGVTSTTSAFQVNGSTSLANTNQATFDYDTSQARILSHNSSGSSIAFFTNSGGSNVTQKVTIDSSGRMLLGTTTPTSNQAAQALTIALQNSGNTGITLRSGTGGGDLNEGSIFFSDATSGAGEYAGYLQYSHANEYFRIGVNSTERVRIDAGGNMNVTGIATATAFVPTTGQLSHRNIVVNGDMTIAQRGTSSAGGEGYKTVDRFQYYKSGTNETPNQAQVDVASGTTPYSLGFRKAYQIENGNQSSAGSSDLVFIETNLEAQDIANSGWNYTDPNSYITLSFWVKASVAQNYYGYLLTVDGTAQRYTFETGSLSANTWTKITKTIPGNSNLQFDNDNNKGLGIVWWPYLGDTYTSSSVTLNQWGAWSTGTRTPDYDRSSSGTWYMTNDATFEITGVQLEVGPVATPFEHLSLAENKRRCYRYCQRGRHVSSCLVGTPGTYYFSRGNIPLFTPMRATVTGTLKAATWNSNRYFQYMTWSSGTNVTAAPASTTFASGNISDASSDIVSVVLHISISSGGSNSPLPANGPGSNNVYPIEYYDVLLEAEI